MESKVNVAPAATAYYKWKWVWSDTNKTSIESHEQYIQEGECRKAALRCEPIYDTCDCECGVVAELIITPYYARDTSLLLEDAKGNSYDLDHGITVEAAYFEGKPQVAIRQWIDGHPTKKGITLSPERWLRLLCLKENIENSMQEIRLGKKVKSRLHVGGPVYLSIASPYWTLNIREWFMKDGVIQPGWKGIVLRFGDWDKLLSLKEDVECIPEVHNAKPCYFDDDHQNQFGAMMCQECNPFEYKN